MKAIVTGHSRGLGAAIAASLLARNIPVLGLARQRNDTLAAQFPALLQQEEMNLADCDAFAAWLAGEALGRFTAGTQSILLVNNAGVVHPVGPLAMQEVGEVARAVSLNVAAPLMLSSALAAMAVADKRILHISSGAGRSPYPGWSVYCATKAALDHHARSVVLDQNKGLRICSLAPGVIDTDMQADIRATSLERFPMRERFEGLKRDGALVSPEDCAQRLVDYLLSDAFGQAPVTDLREIGG